MPDALSARSGCNLIAKFNPDTGGYFRSGLELGQRSFWNARGNGWSMGRYDRHYYCEDLQSLRQHLCIDVQIPTRCPSIDASKVTLALRTPHTPTCRRNMLGACVSSPGCSTPHASRDTSARPQTGDRRPRRSRYGGPGPCPNATSTLRLLGDRTAERDQRPTSQRIGAL